MDSQANASSFMQMLSGQMLSRIGVGIILADQDGIIQWVNDRQQWFTSVPAQGLQGLSVFEHPGLNSGELREAIQFVLIKGKTRHLVLRKQRLSCRIEVSPLLVEERLLGAAIFIYEAGHTASCSTSAGEPCLNQLVADEQRAMVQLLSSLLDAMPFAVAAAAKDGAVLYANSAWRAGYAADALGRPISSMLPETVRSQVDAALKSSWQDGSSRMIPGRGNGLEAGHYWVAPLPANQDLTIGLVVALQNLPSGAADARNSFALQMTNVCQFAARIVHDIRNPLTALMCELELLRNDNLYEPGGVHKFQGAIDLFSHQLQQISSILEEIEPMGVEEPGPTDVCAIADIVLNARVVADWRRPYKSVNIALDIPDDLPPLFCDGLRLQKALSGLLLNALDEAGAAGSVSLSASPLPDDELALRLIYSTAMPGLTEPLAPQPPWRSANLRLALAYAIIIELGGHFEMRRLPGGEREITIRFAGRKEPLSPLPLQPSLSTFSR